MSIEKKSIFLNPNASAPTPLKRRDQAEGRTCVQVRGAHRIPIRCTEANFDIRFDQDEVSVAHKLSGVNRAESILLTWTGSVEFARSWRSAMTK